MNNECCVGDKKIWIGAAILGASLILSAFVGAYTFYKVRSLDDFLSVTGSNKTKVTADIAKWSMDFSRTVKESNLRGGYDQMTKDLTVIKSFFKSQGIEDTTLVISPVFMDQVYKYDNGNNYQTEKEYTLRQTIQLNLTDVVKMTNLAKETRKIVDGGVLLNQRPVEYYYSKLPELRVSLLADAIKDAKSRAEQLVSGTGRAVGSLKNASTGVVQVLPENSLEVSDYGAYDTSTVNKEVMITVRASFNIK